MTEYIRWYEKARVWAQVNLTEDDPGRDDLPVWKEFWRENGIQGVVINAGGIVSYYPSRYEGQYHARNLGGRDYFGEWNRAARECGLSVVARMDINRTNGELFSRHPEWYMKNRDGNPVMAQERYMTCINGGYYREYIPAIFREIAERYHPDGFADNSWSGNDRRTICYCSACRDRFREDAGSELPERADWTDPVYRRWVRWSYALRVELFRFYESVVRECGGEDCLWCGMLNADPFETGGRFYDLKAIIPGTRMVFCDHQSRYPGGGFGQNILNGLLLNLLSGSRINVAESMAHYYKGVRTFRLTAATPREARTWMNAGAAGGLSPWMHVISANLLDRRRLNISGELLRTYADNAEALAGRRFLAEVGILWNQETAVYYGRDDSWNKCAAAFRGTAKALMDEGIPFLPVHADDLDAYRNQLRVLVLPNLAILTDKQEAKLSDWAAGGGSLILTGDTGLFDEDGEWKGPGPLYDILRVTPGRDTLGSAVDQDSWAVQDGHSYLRIESRPEFLADGLEDTDIVPFGGTIRVSSSDGPLRPVMRFIPPFPIYPPEFSYIREPGTAAAVYAGELAGGARVVYMPAGIDAAFGRFGLPDLRRVLAGAVRYVLSGIFGAKLDTPGPGMAGFVLSESGGHLMAHVINLAGTGGAPGTVENVLPFGPVRIRLSEELLQGSGSGRTEEGASCGQIPLPEAQLMIGTGNIRVLREKDTVVLELDRLGEQALISL